MFCHNSIILNINVNKNRSLQRTKICRKCKFQGKCANSNRKISSENLGQGKVKESRNWVKYSTTYIRQIEKINYNMSLYGKFWGVFFGNFSGNCQNFDLWWPTRHSVSSISAYFLKFPNFLKPKQEAALQRCSWLWKDVQQLYSKFTGKHSCRSVISKKLLCNFIKITLRYGCSPVNLLHIFRTPFYKNTYGELLLPKP